jgi:hypothetical protein
MTPYNAKHEAVLHGIMPSAALKMRIRYLEDQLAIWDRYEECETDIPAALTVSETLVELELFVGALKSLHEKPNKNEVTPDMLARAKAFPMEELMKFKHGKCHCFAHDDKSPSMFFAFRSNKINCPVCDRSWDTVDLLTDRDGLTFTRAVKKLCSM